MGRGDTKSISCEETFVAYSIPGGSTYEFLRLGNPIAFSDSEDVFVVAGFDKLGKYAPLYFPVEAALGQIEFRVTNNHTFSIASTDRSDYDDCFEKCMQAILSGQSEKLILSRIISLDIRIDPYDIFNELCQRHPEAYTFIINIPSLGMWIGASPELLLKQITADTYQTAAVAGTMPDLGVPLDQVNWGTKEIKEQGYLTRFLEEFLKINALEKTISETRTIKAGNVLHIATDIVFKTELSLPEIVAHLHPGPAISGYPKKESIELVRHIEGHDRELYCGFLGRIKEGRSELYINLRSMKVASDRVSLFVGGGITRESVCTEEWNETIHKARNIINVLAQYCPVSI